MACHADLKIDRGLPVRSHDPNRATQCGTDEPATGRLRQVHPKRHDFSLHCPDGFDAVAVALDDRSRRPLSKL